MTDKSLHSSTQSSAQSSLEALLEATNALFQSTSRPMTHSTESALPTVSGPPLSAADLHFSFAAPLPSAQRRVSSSLPLISSTHASSTDLLNFPSHASSMNELVPVQPLPMLLPRPPPASFADESESAQSKRRRVSRACDICWKKKIKCHNDAQATCDSCKLNGFNCTYIRDAKRRGPKSMNPFIRDGALTSKDEIVMDIQKHISLIDNEVIVPTWDLIDLYFVYVYPIHPVIPKNVFMDNVWNESPLLLFSMYALSARYKHIGKSTDHALVFEEGRGYYKLARNLVDRSLDKPTLSTVLALRILAGFALSIGDVTVSRVFYGMVMTLTKEMRLYEPISASSRQCPYMSKETENEIRRRLWWASFQVDVKSSAVARRPGSINLSMCRIPLPYPDEALADPTLKLQAKEEALQISTFSSTSLLTPPIPIKGEQGYLMALLRIHRQINEFYLEYFPSNKASKEGRELALAQLDASLKTWFDSLPEEYKSLSPEQFVKGEELSTMPWAALFLHLFYQTAIVMLHKHVIKKLVHSLLEQKSMDIAMAESGALPCLLSLHSVTSLLTLALSVNPELLFITAYAGHCIYETGLIHVELGKAMPGSSLLARHFAHLDVHLSALKALGKYWVMPAFKMCGFLTDMRDKMKADSLRPTVTPLAITN